MRNRRNMREKLVALVVVAIFFIGTAINYTNLTYNSLDVVQEIATVANTPTNDEAQETDAIDATEAPLDGEYIEDENILDSTYYSYGNGCLFVTVEKEIEQPLAETGDTGVVSDSAVQESTSSGSAVTTEMENTGIVSSKELVKACFTEEEQQALINGENKEIRIIIRNKDKSRMDEETIASMDDAVESYSADMEGLSFGDYISVIIKKKDEEGKWKKIKEFYSDLKIYLDIPKDMQIETGTYYLISLHDGKKDLLKDADSYGNVLTFSINRSAVYGLACEIPVEEEEVTPEPVVEQSALALFWERLNNEEFCLWHWFDISILIIGITWVAAIDSKKKRTIFFGVMSVLSVVLGVMGHCEFDWPFAIGTILIMLAIYIWRWYCQRKEERGF